MEKLGNQLLLSFESSYGELLHLLNDLELGDYDKPCWHPRGPTSVADFVDLLIQELALHGWDIRSKLDQKHHINAALLPIVLEMIPGWLRMGFHPGPAIHTSIRYGFSVSDDLLRHDVVVDGHTFRLETRGTHPLDVTFRCDMETYVLITSGRLHIDLAVTQGHMSYCGDPVIAYQFSQWFPAL